VAASFCVTEVAWGLSSIAPIRSATRSSAPPSRFIGTWALGSSYVIDFLIEGSLIVEIKSVDRLLPIHSAQLMTYMRLLRVSSGLLMNFNVDILPHGIKRVLR